MAYLMIAFAATMWGIIGFFVKGLSVAGFSAMEIVTIRVVTAACLLVMVGFAFFRPQLRINGKDFPLFIGTGLLSIVFFNWCYFTAIEKMNIPVAAALLYTSPAFVITFSVLFLKEKLNHRKVLAVIGTICGSAMVAEVSLTQGSSFPAASILIGLGAGLGYALYSIFGKIVLKSYHPFTLTLYTFVTAAIFLVPFFIGKTETLNILNQPTVWFYALGLGVVPTVLAYFAYSWGLEKVESSQAAIIATVEPVAATILGLMVYNEQISLVQFFGILLILGSVIFVNLPQRHRNANQNNHKNSAPV
ncbi:EamA family transporter [Mesobacillus maritimus]|uniref:DMT family transporter n=1 Tax=Mesobacillus maritimus TaxID=1643336 RepID=UPI00203F9F43|nr:EamA family transporter [Mesobacillus maritimus]MCM3669412.1 EamA family transporter [Mesobacillus maritimus]